MIDVNQQALLELLKVSLFGGEPSLPEQMDWDAVFEEAQAQTVVALAAAAVPPDISKKWVERVQQNTAHYMRVLYEQSALTNLLSEYGIPFVILKGSSAAMYYPVPSRRTMGDIDFLVCPDRFAQTQQLLEEKGYAYQGDYGDGRDYTYYKGGVILELHQRYSDVNWEIEDTILDGLAHPELRELSGNRFPALPDAVNGLVLLDHVRHHLYGGLGLRQIIDWMMFIHAVLTDEFWHTSFYPLARKARLDRLAVIMTQMCRLWLGLPDSLTWCDDADNETALQLLENILHYGNFGRKDPYEYRPTENVAMGVKEQGLFRFLQNTGLSTWKACRRWRFLRPFAWLYQIFRFIGKGVASLFRGADFRKDMARGSEKADFFERLGIAAEE